MPLTQQQLQQAGSVQAAAAHDQSQQVRLVAGPGTGKSYSIEARVLWLLQNGVSPGSICGVSFTRASSTDLRTRIQSYGATHNHPEVANVRVSTLHSLALRMLRAAGLLHYPADPLVLDGWELENIFDAEFGDTANIGKRRREDIRREHEAFWNTGAWNPANYVPADPPVSQAERNSFNGFHGPRTQVYSCVLPGEIVRQCVEHVEANTFDPVQLIGLSHLIVDEYQDLNPVDQRLIRQLILRGVTTFIAGDDDQSVYSFRYASPAGIQTFVADNPGAGDHTLVDCFRSSTSVVLAANALITSFAQPGRVPKQLNALYSAAAPPVAGVVQCWRCSTAVAEADLIAQSCAALLAAGVTPSDILILICNQREQLQLLCTAFENNHVPAVPPPSEGFKDSNPGRLVTSLLRVVCQSNDYVAHRTILGVRPGVGIGTCNGIAEVVLQNHLNFRDLFYSQAIPAVFNGRQATALTNARSTCSQIAGWSAQDTLDQRRNLLRTIVQDSFQEAAASEFIDYVANLPGAMNLEELRNWIAADNDEQQAELQAACYQRLGLPIPSAGLLPDRVRMMSMHGAKGLSARVVFIPGLEEQLIPGPWRSPYPGLVLEAARLLYVSITRARAACIISYPSRRLSQGRMQTRSASRFATALGGAFAARAFGLQTLEVQAIVQAIAGL